LLGERVLFIGREEGIALLLKIEGPTLWIFMEEISRLEG